jgi:hypothetical protein
VFFVSGQQKVKYTGGSKGKVRYKTPLMVWLVVVGG